VRIRFGCGLDSRIYSKTNLVNVRYKQINNIFVRGQVILVVNASCKGSNTLKYLRIFSTKLQLNLLTKELSLYRFDFFFRIIVF
jgi:hypothetical protein